MINIKLEIEVESEDVTTEVILTKNQEKLTYSPVITEETEYFDMEDIIEALKSEIKIVDLSSNDFYNLVELNFSGAKNSTPEKSVFLITRNKVFDCELKQLSPFKYNIDGKSLFNYIIDNFDDFDEMEDV